MSRHNQAIMCSILSPSLEIACALNVGITCVFCFGGIPPRLLFNKAQIIQWVSPLKYSYTVRGLRSVGWRGIGLGFSYHGRTPGVSRSNRSTPFTNKL